MMSFRPSVVIIFNEAALPALFYAVIRRRNIYLIPVPALVPALQSMLNRIASAVIAWGYANRYQDFDSHLAEFKQARVPRHYRDAYRRAEPWIAREFGFAELLGACGDDAYALKHIACNHAFKYLDQVHVLNYLDKTLKSGDQIAGTTRLIRGLHEAVFGETLTHPGGNASRAIGLLCGILNAIIVLAGILVDAVRGISLAEVLKVRIFMGVDFIGRRENGFDDGLWDEFDAEPGGVRVVFRNRRQRRANEAALDTVQSIALGDGGFPVSSVCAEILAAFLRMGRLLYGARLLDALHSRTVLTLPYKRMLMRKLLFRYDFEYFWGNDDYNVDHILRSQELRKVGTKPIGAPHGLPIPTDLVPMWRFVDFDRYYVIGSALGDVFACSWPSYMSVRAFGGMGMNRKRAAENQLPRLEDIIFQTKIEWAFLDVPQRETLKAVAERYPEKTIYLQVKGSFSHTAHAKAFVVWAAETFDNVVVSDEHITDVFLKAGYLITDPSTVSAEAIQFNIVTLLMDYDDRDVLYFRQFSGLCAKTPDELIDRLDGYVTGKQEYPWDNFERLVRLGPESVFDVIRQDFSTPITGENTLPRVEGI